MNKRLILLCAVIVIIGLAGILIVKKQSDNGSHFSRTVEEDAFRLEFDRLNDTLREEYYLEKGDIVEVKVICSSGVLRLSICMSGAEPVYEGRNPQPEAFSVTIPESGLYVFSTVGERAEGSVDFLITRQSTRNEA